MSKWFFVVLILFAESFSSYSWVKGKQMKALLAVLWKRQNVRILVKIAGVLGISALTIHLLKKSQNYFFKKKKTLFPLFNDPGFPNREKRIFFAMIQNVKREVLGKHSSIEDPLNEKDFILSLERHLLRALKEAFTFDEKVYTKREGRHHLSEPESFDEGESKDHVSENAKQVSEKPPILGSSLKGKASVKSFKIARPSNLSTLKRGKVKFSRTEVGKVIKKKNENNLVLQNSSESLIEMYCMFQALSNKKMDEWLKRVKNYAFTLKDGDFKKLKSLSLRDLCNYYSLYKCLSSSELSSFLFDGNEEREEKVKALALEYKKRIYSLIKEEHYSHVLEWLHTSLIYFFSEKYNEDEARVNKSAHITSFISSLDNNVHGTGSYIYRRGDFLYTPFKMSFSVRVYDARHKQYRDIILATHTLDYLCTLDASANKEYFLIDIYRFLGFLKSVRTCKNVKITAWLIKVFNFFFPCFYDLREEKQNTRYNAAEIREKFFKGIIPSYAMWRKELYDPDKTLMESYMYELYFLIYEFLRICAGSLNDDFFEKKRQSESLKYEVFEDKKEWEDMLGLKEDEEARLRLLFGSWYRVYHPRQRLDWQPERGFVDIHYDIVEVIRMLFEVMESIVPWIVGNRSSEGALVYPSFAEKFKEAKEKE